MGRRAARRDGARLARCLIVAGLAMVPWLVVLARSLPATSRVSDWSTAWIGLDGLEGVGLLATGALLARRDARARLAATGTATLLVVDAWLDLVTSPAGRPLLLAGAMAALVELPVACLCAAIALGHLPRERFRPAAGAVAPDRAGSARLRRRSPPLRTTTAPDQRHDGRRAAGSTPAARARSRPR